MKVGELPPDVFFVPCYAILLSLALYGKIENAYMIYGQLGVINVTTCVLFNFAFLGSILFGCLYVVERTTPLMDSGAGVRAKALSAAFLVLFLSCYATAIRIVDAQNVEARRIPNLLPWLVTWRGYRNYIFLDPYHIVLFVVGFLCLLAAMSIPIGLTFGKKAFVVSLISNLGALLVGLVYQDWFWFVSHPTLYLTYGCRYGVFFDQWMDFLCVHLPTMYVIAHLLGLPMIAVPPLAVCPRRKVVPYIIGLFVLLAVFLVSGLTYLKLVKNVL